MSSDPTSEGEADLFRNFLMSIFKLSGGGPRRPVVILVHRWRHTQSHGGMTPYEVPEAGEDAGLLLLADSSGGVVSEEVVTHGDGITHLHVLHDQLALGPSKYFQFTLIPLASSSISSTSRSTRQIPASCTW